MIDLILESTPTTPYVRIDSHVGHIVFSGKSSPANSLGFYYPLLNKIKTLFQDKKEPIRVDLSFKYFNTSSSKCLFDLFKVLKGFQKQGKILIINWYYEEDDDDMLETGEDYADILDIHFNFIEVEEINEVQTRQAV